MFNFYPWGLSLNVVEPLSHQRTRIRFRTYYFESAAWPGALNELDITEMEDEAVVESVQRGVGLRRYYQTGRYSPAKNKACIIFTAWYSSF